MFSVDYQPCTDTDVSLIKTKYKNHTSKPHYHLDYHIGLVTRGEQIFNYKGSKHHTGPGFIQVMMPGHVHDANTVNGQGFSARIFSLNTSWFNRLEQDKYSISNLPQIIYSIKDEKLYHQLIALHSLLSEKQNFKLAADSMQVELFSALFGRYGRVKQEKANNIGVKQLDVLRDYLMANLSEKVSLNEIANLCDLSESQLLRRFKRTVGITPYAWLARLRLEKALILLKAGESSTSVSHKVGFYDQAHFVKAFKLAYGITPSKIHQN